MKKTMAEWDQGAEDPDTEEPTEQWKRHCPSEDGRYRYRNSNVGGYATFHYPSEIEDMEAFVGWGGDDLPDGRTWPRVYQGVWYDKEQGYFSSYPKHRHMVKLVATHAIMRI